MTLVAALEMEDAACRPGMVDQHRQRLSAMVCAVDVRLAEGDQDELGQPGIGLALVLFAGELASALRPDEFRTELPAGTVAASEQIVTAAMLAAAGCLLGVVEALGVLSELVG